MQRLYAIVVFCNCIFFYSFAKQTSCNSSISFSPTKPVIIFDLINVVIKENQSAITKQIGYGTLASYTLTHWKNPGHRCLDMLSYMSTKESQRPHCTLTFQDKIMPRCLVEFQEGKKNCEQVKQEIMQEIECLDNEKFFTSSKEKKLMTTIMDLVLNPDVAEKVIEPIKQTLQLIKQLKEHGYSVYLFANAPHELYTLLQKKFPEILQLFEGIIVSCKVQTVKPNLAIFEHLIKTHNLDPHNCILIDDLPETAVAAKGLGMNAIVFEKASQVKKELKKLGIKL